MGETEIRSETDEAIRERVVDLRLLQEHSALRDALTGLRDAVDRTMDIDSDTRIGNAVAIADNLLCAIRERREPTNFRQQAVHPETGEVQNAEYLDDYYGRHRFGVRFSDGQVFPDHKVTAIPTIPNERGGMIRHILPLLITATLSQSLAADETFALRDRAGNLRVVTLTSDGGKTEVTIPALRVIATDGTITPNDPDDPLPPAAGWSDVVRRALATVTGDDDKVKNARKLAVIFKTVADEIEGSKFNNTAEIPEAMKRLGDIILGKDAQKWADARTTIGAELTRLKLSDAASIAKAFRDIANELESQQPPQTKEEALGFIAIIELIVRLLPLILEIIRGFK